MCAARKEEGKQTYVLGINCAYHESSACLIGDGKIIAAAEEERFNRRKHGKKACVYNPHEIPRRAIQFCLEYGGVSWDQIQHIGVSIDPEERRKRNTEHSHPYPIEPLDFGSPEGEELFHRLCMEIPGKISELAGRNIRDIFSFIPHHLCHAASSYFVSPFNDAMVLAVDGIGEFASTWLGRGRGNRLEKIKEIDYPGSLGFLWEKFAKYLGFTEYDACKVMGLATSATSYIPGYIFDNFEEIVQLLPHGEFRVDDTIMRFRNEDYSELSRRFFKERRDKLKDPTATIQEMMLASALQKRTEEAILHMVEYLMKETSSRNLCLSGGVALNSVANAKILRKYPDMKLFIQPAAHDAGTAIGAAYYIWNVIMGKPKDESQTWGSPYLGPEFPSTVIEQALRDQNVRYRKYSSYEELVDHTAKLLVNGKIVGWYQGRLEIGPRALGNRSLLAHPADGRIKEKINAMGIKNREEFRPFAPSIMEEHAAEWVDCPCSSPYMLLVFDVKPDKLGRIDAVTHSDGTSRIQSVNSRQNSLYYELLKKFRDLSGIPLFLNTSFNSQEPIVTSPQDAVRTFTSTRFDALVMGKYVAER